MVENMIFLNGYNEPRELSVIDIFPGKYDQALDEMIDDALSRGFLSKDFRTADSLAAGILPIDSHVTALPA